VSVATAVTLLAPQLAIVKQDLLFARERARTICLRLPEGAFGARPAPGTWSIAECLTHLNFTSERFLPLLDQALRDLRAQDLCSPGPYSRGLIGWALARFLEPPHRMRIKTAPAFVPARVDSMNDVLERFDYLQLELQARVDRAAGMSIDRIHVVSPFDGRVKYNLYAAFCILNAHQRRHLWQAERVKAIVAPSIPTPV
jgi:hypothetical protein